MVQDSEVSQAKRDVLLLVYGDEQSSKRFAESQLFQMFGFLSALCGAILIAIGFDDDISKSDTLLGGLLVIFGLAGALFIYKANERIRRHSTRMESLKVEFLSEREGQEVIAVTVSADTYHNKKFPRTSKIRSHWSWVLLCFGYSTLGQIIIGIGLQ